MRHPNGNQAATHLSQPSDIIEDKLSLMRGWPGGGLTRDQHAAILCQMGQFVKITGRLTHQPGRTDCGADLNLWMTARDPLRTSGIAATMPFAYITNHAFARPSMSDSPCPGCSRLRHCRTA